jgi:fructose-specific component phosphotransferase system IIB-like protein
MVMSDAVWPVFEDGQKHSLCDEGISVLRAYQDLDAIAAAAGRMLLSAFDEHADVPADVVAQLAEEAQDIPDLSGFPVVWHDPADAVATLDVILAALASADPACADLDDPECLAQDLKAFRETLEQAATRKTRFNLTIA